MPVIELINCMRFLSILKASGVQKPKQADFGWIKNNLCRGRVPLLGFGLTHTGDSALTKASVLLVKKNNLSPTPPKNKNQAEKLRLV